MSKQFSPEQLSKINDFCQGIQTQAVEHGHSFARQEVAGFETYLSMGAVVTGTVGAEMDEQAGWQKEPTLTFGTVLGLVWGSSVLPEGERIDQGVMVRLSSTEGRSGLSVITSSIIHRRERTTTWFDNYSYANTLFIPQDDGMVLVWDNGGYYTVRSEHSGVGGDMDTAKQESPRSRRIDHEGFARHLNGQTATIQYALKNMKRRMSAVAA